MSSLGRLDAAFLIESNAYKPKDYSSLTDEEMYHSTYEPGNFIE